MPIHESSINFRRLIQDLADMYPFDVSEVVVTELIANALDAKATKISINYDPDNKILIVKDNGSGMAREQFDEYHDFAAGLKKRGTGIGFAGLGAKISFNIASRVFTETKSNLFSGGSNWYLQSNKKLVWEELPAAILKQNGTRVEVHFNKEAKISFTNTEDVFELIKRQYLPLLDRSFLKIYKELGQYSQDLRFIVNNTCFDPVIIKDKFQLEKVKEFVIKKRNRIYGGGIFGISKEEYPVSTGVCGILLCTYGKVIKAEFFNQFPGAFGTRIFGIVEIPELIDFLTTQKTDFTRKGQFKKFESLMSPIRLEFITWLKEIGIESKEITDSSDAIRLEREIKRILDDIPEISDFFGFWSKKNLFTKSEHGTTSTEVIEGVGESLPIGEGARGVGPGVADTGPNPGEVLQAISDGGIIAQPISRSTKRGPKIGFKEDKNKFELSWVEGSNIIINVGHPIYEKAKTYKKEFLLYLFSIACAIQRHKNEDESEIPDFYLIDRVMNALGKK